MSVQLRSLTWALAVVVCVHADIYMHNPRGSNDRNCERNANRNNGNRLFDSQNNNAGGYACPRAVGDESMQDEMGDFVFANGIGNTVVQPKRMYYYEGSILPIEWTDQHGCGGNSKISCEIVIQYACEDTLDPAVNNFWPWMSGKGGSDNAAVGQKFRSADHIASPRDGIPRDDLDAATDTIPDLEANAIPDSVANRRFGMHENFDHYQQCQHTERNKGLYTADQNVRRNDQRGTRQNPNGNRNGYECPEERDYYPWWHPSPWVDVAVLTDSAWDTPCSQESYYENKNCSSRCSYYMENTMNWNTKGYCDVDHSSATNADEKLLNSAWINRKWHNNNASCEAAGFVWYEISHADNLPSMATNNNFVCAKTQFSRTNQLGNAAADVVSQSMWDEPTSKSEMPHGINANRFLWQIPEVPEATVLDTDYFGSMESAYKSCTLRIRYNISSADFMGWPQEANGEEDVTPMVDSTRSSITLPTDTDIVPLIQDPYVYIAPEGTVQPESYNFMADEMFLSLAVNTNQYSRTFQDRSYSFTIKKIPTETDVRDGVHDGVEFTQIPMYDFEGLRSRLDRGGKIINVNVRGKRGNIVQTFPSVEYDFVPNALVLEMEDMVHWQWTGSDYNPRRGCNNGEGGPPDLNTFSSAANAGLASRADRSNVVFTNYMAHNVPRDYLGYDRNDVTLSDLNKTIASQEAVNSFAPCTNGADNVDACYQQILRLAFLGQHTDAGSLIKRNEKKCLTKNELDLILNSAERENHPLNCAKINAKPHPYFDGGIMMMLRAGFFSFFSSRNNNFSNRQQIGVMCVRNASITCEMDTNSGVIQDTNPMTTGTTAQASSMTYSKCNDEASDPDGANTNGARSCAISGVTDGILQGETLNVQEGDNDKFGDGNENDCPVLTVNQLLNPTTTEATLVLAMIMLGVGLFVSWLCYFLYNRYYGKRDSNAEHRGDNSWQKEQGDSLIRDEFKASVYSNAKPGRSVKGAGAGGAALSGTGISMTTNPSGPGSQAFSPSKKVAGARGGSNRVTLSSMKSAAGSSGRKDFTKATSYKDMV
jgi:hypothetical protein